MDTILTSRPANLPPQPHGAYALRTLVSTAMATLSSFLRYCTVGTMATLLHCAVRVAQMVATLLVLLLVSFALNRAWTFA